MTQINSKLELEAFCCSNWNEINKYIDQQMESLPTPFYSSVDIRESSSKVAPVDHNMYPAGFNNVCSADLDAAIDIMTKTINKYQANAKVIGIIPESNTKNTFYLDHLAYLSRLIRDAGFEVKIISLDEELFSANQNSIELISASKFDLTILRGTFEANELYANGEKIDFAVLNNDQSTPLKVDWNSVKTPIAPTPLIGWFKRQKNKHFAHYKMVADQFCEEFSINPEILQAKFKTVEGVDYSTKEGLENLAKSTDELLADLPENSKVFIKASQGTYGMGISVVSSGEELLNMNRKTRNKMDVGKNKIKFTSVLIQEGIETILKYDEMPAEVSIYLIDGKSVGGFMRANSQKSTNANLNSRGMVFQKFCISEIKENQEHKCKEALYTLVARLATLASAYEIKEIL